MPGPRTSVASSQMVLGLHINVYKIFCIGSMIEKKTIKKYYWDINNQICRDGFDVQRYIFLLEHIGGDIHGR